MTGRPNIAIVSQDHSFLHLTINDHDDADYNANNANNNDDNEDFSTCFVASSWSSTYCCQDIFRSEIIFPFYIIHIFINIKAVLSGNREEKHYHTKHGIGKSGFLAVRFVTA